MKYIQADGTYINDETITVLPEGAALLSDAAWDSRAGEPDASTLSEKQAVMWDRIQVVRDNKQLSGCKVVVDSVDKWYHTTTDSRLQHLGLNMLGANIPAELYWKTMDGSLALMTQAIAGQIFIALMTLDMTAFAVGESHKAAMLLEEDPCSYDFSAGWPQVYADV